MTAPAPPLQRGFLVLADISGFTAYLAGTELDHAHEIVRELLEFIVDRLRPVLTLAQIEGDAVFAHAPDDQLDRGETLLEVIETTYVAFRDRLASIGRRLTCTCQACQSVDGLDLKILVHHGEYVPHRVGDQPELMGRAPLFVRQREWKEPVTAAAGWQGYLLITQSGLARLGLAADGLRPFDAAPHGEPTFGLDLQRRYAELVAARRSFVQAAGADVVLMREFEQPPHRLWEWLNEPAKRTQWMRGRVWSAGQRLAGRSGVGAQNHCDHGVGTLMETILDWRPFDYYTVEVESRPGPMKMIYTHHLEPLADGRRTRLRAHYRLLLPLPFWMPHWLARLLLARLHGGDLTYLANRLAGGSG